MGKKRVISHTDIGKQDISLLKLINYNLLFFIPLLLALLLSLWLGGLLSDFFEASAHIVARLFMFVFTFGAFFFIIPFIRRREKVVGIRYSVLAFFIVGLGLTLPSAMRGDFGVLFSLIPYFGHYLLLTFIFAPEVLGIHSNLAEWFAHGKQLIVLIVYIGIVVLYTTGFGLLYHDIYMDAPAGEAFNMGFEKEVSVGTFIYYSIVTFATIGYGEITPLSTAARTVASLEIMFGMIINVLFIAMLLVYISSVQSFMLRKEEQEIEREERQIEKEGKALEEVREDVENLGEQHSDDTHELMKRIKDL